MMKKIIVLTIVAVFMASCSEQQLLDEFTNEQFYTSSEQQDSESVILNSYLEKARWGDGNAFLKLAECYHDGIGVKADFMGMMSMLAMADQYGASPKSTDSYLLSLPETDNTKLIVEAFACLDRKNLHKSDSITDMLIGVIQIERGDTIGGKQNIQRSAEMGSSFAKILLCAVPSPGERHKDLDIDMLKSLSPNIPLANKLLGDMYSGYEKGCIQDEHLAAYFYSKADEQGCLGKRPARYLINYYERNEINIEPKEMERLRILSGNTLMFTFPTQSLLT